mgnify:CR=1 FL=1
MLKAALADKDWALRVARRGAAQAARSVVAPTSMRDPARAPTTAAARRYQAARLDHRRRCRRSVYIDTDRGTIQVELAVLDAPLTVEQLHHARAQGFFNGLSIHRVVPNFVVQDGDPRGDGEGGPATRSATSSNERPYPARHGRHGARLGRHRRQPVLHHALAAAASLDAKYTVFGRVVSGHGRGGQDSAVRCDSPRACVGWRADDEPVAEGGWRPAIGRGDSRPFYVTGEIGLPFLAGLLLPALGFLCHCLVIPPSCWV